MADTMRWFGRLQAAMIDAFVELFPDGRDMVDLVEVKFGRTWAG